MRLRGLERRIRWLCHFFRSDGGRSSCHYHNAEDSRLLCLHGKNLSAASTSITQTADYQQMSGDRDSAAADIARTAGIETYWARLAPQDKAERIVRLQEAGHTVAMVWHR